jgi:hypothetical protein
VSHDILIRQLQGALDGKSVRVGTATLTYTAAAVSAAATVNHGLGVTPDFVIAGGTTSAADRHVVNYVAGSRNSTSFQLQSEVADGSAVSLSISVFWLAVG